MGPSREKTGKRGEGKVGSVVELNLYLCHLYDADDGISI